MTIAASHVKADPKRPYKAYAAFVVTFLGTLWANLQGRADLAAMSAQDWLTVIIPTIIATGAVYGVSNPKVVDTNGAPVRGEGGYANVGVVGVIGLVILILILLAVTGVIGK